MKKPAPRYIPERKELVLQAVRDYQAANPHMNPTIRDLCKLTGITSTSVLNFYLGKLARDGAIVRYHGVARGISAMANN
jgi:hypothetical protein